MSDSYKILKVDKTEYKIKFNNKAIRKFEQISGNSFFSIAGDVREGGKVISLVSLCYLLIAGLEEYHGDLSLNDIDEIIDTVGVEKVLDKITVAIQDSTFVKGKKKTSKKKSKKSGSGKKSSK